jgi:phage shock protein A
MPLESAVPNARPDKQLRLPVPTNNLATELLARIGRVREEVTAVERLLPMTSSANKALARRVADLKETCNEVEAQLNKRSGEHHVEEAR